MSWKALCVCLYAEGILLTVEAQAGCGPTVKEFKAKIDTDEAIKAKIAQLRADVEKFALSFPMPGYDDV